MNHPKPEEWVPYVYGENTSKTRGELAAHLRDCPQCREEIDTWKRSLRRLDAWKVSKPRPRAELLMPFLKWAAAAAVVLVVGISIGRASAPRVDVEKVRLAVTKDIKRDLGRELGQMARQEAARAATLTLVSGHTYTDQMAQQLYLLLKKDIDTVALNSQQLFLLSDYNDPKNPAVPNQ